MYKYKYVNAYMYLFDKCICMLSLTETFLSNEYEDKSRNIFKRRKEIYYLQDFLLKWTFIT